VKGFPLSEARYNLHNAVNKVISVSTIVNLAMYNALHLTVAKNEEWALQGSK
jgi:hypothetical protein